MKELFGELSQDQVEQQPCNYYYVKLDLLLVGKFLQTSLCMAWEEARMLCRVRWTLPDLKHVEDTEALVKELQGRGKASRPDLPPKRSKHCQELGACVRDCALGSDWPKWH